MRNTDRQFCRRTRREFLWETGAGFGALGLSGLLHNDPLLANAPTPDAPKGSVRYGTSERTRMRKFIFNGAIISAAIGLWTTIQTTKSGPRDWRVPLMWISAALSLVIAVGTVVQESREAEDRQLHG